MSDFVAVRAGSPDDLDSVAEIYAHHVVAGVATFEVAAPDRLEWLRRFTAITSSGLPFLIAAIDSRIVGYAHCAPWKPRPAYRHTVEDSVYVAPDAVGRGVGGRLLDALLHECARAGVREVIAVIVDADGAASLALHRHRGFADAGRLKSVGFKHGRWLDTVLLQRSIEIIPDRP